ncbi:hypothetical protein B1C78_16265 [Thioalkalivibrio denitrificans]|uniref:ABC-type transport auxiliary lipoprotein component domain-containing protein n=1 Tax=Thioalkalivibrio denitrificans TaxID=108003 RepID=A0A1V3N8T9_9GAMM|nr:ABC-type transport auxiliary lipoprotein family protein [Thioalkalivibrio denitrificans]OOG21445.1 hypothetical protein B1C78_16265 [Thioalkalivibrio denitrificans]
MSATRHALGLVATPFLIMLVSACTVGVDLQRPALERQRFVMDVERVAGHETREGGPTLTLGPVRVAPEFEHRSFVYRIDDRRYQGDFYNQWFTSPRDQVAGAAATWFSGSAAFGGLVPPALAGSADYRLDLSAAALYWDLRDARRHTAEVVLDAHLSRRTDAGRVSVTSTRASASRIVTGTGAEARVEAMEKALAEALRALEETLERVLAESGSDS